MYAHVFWKEGTLSAASLDGDSDEEKIKDENRVREEKQREGLRGKGYQVQRRGGTSWERIGGPFCILFGLV